jgi:hypothetical protein
MGYQIQNFVLGYSIHSIWPVNCVLYHIENNTPPPVEWFNSGFLRVYLKFIPFNGPGAKMEYFCSKIINMQITS